MIAMMIIIYTAFVLLLFKVMRLRPTAYLIASLIVAGVLLIGGVVVVWTQSAPMTDKMVTSQYVVQLVPYVKGQVKTVQAEALKPVKKSDLLLEIDPAPYQYTVNQVESQLASAKATVQQAQASLEVATAAVANAQANLAKTKAADELAKITNNVRLQDAKLQQLLVDYQNTVLSAQQQVDNALVGFVQSQAQVVFLRSSAQAASGAFTIALQQYDQGATDFTTVLTAEQNLFQAESNLAIAISNVSLGLTALYRALGGGWQIREDGYFVDAATTAQMRSRTNWGDLLPPASAPQPPAPGLPGPENIGPTIRPPEW
jgi:multidrug resistance efflux pump